LYQIERC